jgi:DNA repair exonuclease SbcCD ATPase subunit
MSDTPETDAAYNAVVISTEAGDSLPKATAMLKLARKLERERDELAALLAAEKATRNSIIEKGVKTERERDEAIKQNAKLRDIAERILLNCETLHPNTVKLHRAELDQLKEGAKCPVCTPEQKCWECADDTSLKEGVK